MFGAVQGAAGGTGIAAPFSNHSSLSRPSMTPKIKSSGSARYSKHKQQLGPFRDDTRLIGLRYDQTVALEPPIPLPPPRSPLRPPPRASSFNLARGAAPTPTPAPKSPVVQVAPPPRPPPPTEQHPALRTISSPRPSSSDKRRDSVYASTISSHSYGSYAYAYYAADSSSDEDEDEDPFVYEKIDAVSGVRPLRFKSGSTGSSVYSVDVHVDHDQSVDQSIGQNPDQEQQKRDHIPQRDTAGVLVQRDTDAEVLGQRDVAQGEETAAHREGSRDGSRVSEEASLSLSPALSVGSTASPSPASPASPATPPPHFSKRFIRSFSLRSGSFHGSHSSHSSHNQSHNSHNQKPSSLSSSLSSSSSSSSSTTSTSPSPSPSSPPLFSTSMKRLRKKSPVAVEDGRTDDDRSVGGNGNGTNTSTSMGMSMGAGSRLLPASSLSSSMSSPLSPSSSNHSSSDSHSRRPTNPIHTPATPAITAITNTTTTTATTAATPTATTTTTTPRTASTTTATPNSPQRPNHSRHSILPSGHGNAGPASPTISTDIPCGSFFEEDDLSKISFSIRGSLIFGGKRPWKTSASTSSATLKMAERDVIPEQSISRTRTNSSPSPSPTTTTTSLTGNTNDTNSKTRARIFPLVHTASKKDHASPTYPPPPPPPHAPARPPREDDMGVAAMIQKPFQLPDSPHLHQHAQPDLPMADSASASHKPPPSIRVISAEAEKESQKVRSLYESGESGHVDGDVPWPLGPPLEPPPEVPSDADGDDAPSDPRPGHPIQPAASTSSPLLQDNHQLAGGIEDWEGIRGQDVDRYGFIMPHQSDLGSRPATATPAGSSSPVRFSSRKHRNVLIRRDFASLSLGAKRGPTKKLSARSLNTHTSEFSVLSRRSVRSTIRQATNKLPHNRDRRLVDEAGDLLALQPGLSFINEDEGAEKVTAELKRKEVKRTEKWRKMAKVVKPGSEGQGTIFYFDAKNPKLIERTWKGIPDCWRSAAWYSFLASSAKADLVNYVSDEELTAAYRRLVEEPSPDDLQIDLDVPRTINQHIMFRRRYRGGQRLLFRVLHALSIYFPDTGYVQGMATLAATLLSYYDEEQCFVMLVRLWQFRGLNRIYQSGFVELIEALKDFETHWLNEKEVADVLKELCIDPTAYATRWYLTLFNLSIPFAVQLRVWDVFMLLGSSPPEQPESSSAKGKEVDGHPSSRGLEILHATSLAIIDTLHATLIDSDFENAMKSLTSWVPIKDEQRFLEIVHVEWKKHQSRQKRKA